MSDCLRHFEAQHPEECGKVPVDDEPDQTIPLKPGDCVKIRDDAEILHPDWRGQTGIIQKVFPHSRIFIVQLTNDDGETTDLGLFDNEVDFLYSTER